MAGGELGQTIHCVVCLAEHEQLVRAERCQEGDESDEYRCDAGHTFSMDGRGTEVTEPLWPPTKAMLDRVA
jgi:hypothetical protein